MIILLDRRPVIRAFERQHICCKIINPFRINLEIHLPGIIVGIAKPGLKGVVGQPSGIGYFFETWRVGVRRSLATRHVMATGAARLGKG